MKSQSRFIGISTVGILCLSLAGCVNSTGANSTASVQVQTASAASLQLKQVIKADQELKIATDMFYSPEAGQGNANGKLNDYSPEALAKSFEANKALLEQLSSIEVDKLSESEQVDYSILRYVIQNRVDQYRFNEHYAPLTAEAGFHAYLSFITRQVVFREEQDYIDYLNRLRAFPRLFDQQTYWLEQGITTGKTQPQVVLKGFEQSITAFITEEPTASVFYAPFNNLPAHLSTETKQALEAQAKEVISKYVVPSYQGFYDFMVERYIPNARQTIAAHDLPDGEAFYQNRINHYTTLSMTADEVHQIGLKEVARIRAEMDEIIKHTKFEGSFADFVAFLRSDPQFYAKTPEQLLKEASFIAKKMDAQLPRLFKTLPRRPYGVVEVPASIAPKYTTGRYSGPASETEAGYYWVNTYALERRPLYVLEALTLHEAVPGHHLQGALASEMENVERFRRDTYISAFGEGWGLYAEWLGLEAGFYQDPYSNFGRLTYEMWRACRLVVDTGMHAKGWTRQQAIDYLASNTALSMHNVTTEIDRYISWPGQALSYKMGEITIKNLRKKAEHELGKDFDVREFHDQILKNGSVPLNLLTQHIDKYIAVAKEAAKK